ncbi:Protein MAK32 [Colletotrichum tanaceti]|nr:Protein MAK32 [Colletotrichum tanaceti]
MRAVHASGICSPNDHELLRMMGVREGPGIPYNRALVESHAIRLSNGEMLQGGSSAPERSTRGRITVIRCGDQGCLTIRRGAEPIWLPPFHDYGSPKVVDPTGAGNAFLGAFAAAFAFAKTRNEVLASAYGAVAASFVVEQIGPPRREVANGKELWNGDGFEERLRQYLSRRDRRPQV